jgi:hypothetical protein
MRVRQYTAGVCYEAADHAADVRPPCPDLPITQDYGVMRSAMGPYPVALVTLPMCPALSDA